MRARRNDVCDSCKRSFVVDGQRQPLFAGGPNDRLFHRPNPVWKRDPESVSLRMRRVVLLASSDPPGGRLESRLCRFYGAFYCWFRAPVRRAGRNSVDANDVVHRCLNAVGCAKSVKANRKTRRLESAVVHGLVGQADTRSRMVSSTRRSGRSIRAQPVVRVRGRSTSSFEDALTVIALSRSRR